MSMKRPKLTTGKCRRNSEEVREKGSEREYGEEGSAETMHWLRGNER